MLDASSRLRTSIAIPNLLNPIDSDLPQASPSIHSPHAQAACGFVRERSTSVSQSSSLAVAAHLDNDIEQSSDEPEPGSMVTPPLSVDEADDCDGLRVHSCNIPVDIEADQLNTVPLIMTRVADHSDEQNVYDSANMESPADDRVTTNDPFGRLLSPPSRFQSTERVSVRLAARNTLSGPQRQSISPFQRASSSDSSTEQSVRSGSRSRTSSGAGARKKKGKRSISPSADDSRGGGDGNHNHHHHSKNGTTKRPKTNSRTNSDILASKSAKSGNRQVAVESAIRMIFMSDNNGGKWEKQAARCMAGRYKGQEVRPCMSCIRRAAGDTCRFLNVRYFARDESNQIVGYAFENNLAVEDTRTWEFPKEWNVPLERRHIDETKVTIASALLSVLEEELRHQDRERLMYRPREMDMRVTCDTCMTSIFSASWMCRDCGREACSDCFHIVADITAQQNGTNLVDVRKLPTRHDFLTCVRRAEHSATSFCPVTRFTRAELEDAVKEMKAVLSSHPAKHGHCPSGSSKNNMAGARPDGPPPVPSEEGQIPSHATPRFGDDEFTEDTFRSLWNLGEPIIVEDLLKKFEIPWTPQHFIETYPKESCVVVECQSDRTDRTTVSDFFSKFGQYENRLDCWKLKDWPPSSHFKTVFPNLFKDFINVVPAPSYVRPDGAMNIASHFPVKAIAPDLGPKMYNAFANTLDVGNKGTTRLHMDMADAVNIMTYAADTFDGKPGYAAWDIFRAQDSDKIRKYLHEKFPGTVVLDPIHNQQFFLDEGMRRELWEGYGVVSHRILQRPGEAIFIPAGCAHQVCNMSDCIKVAIDFVSPENIERCENLTREFRELNQRKSWKEDVLQLRTMMWFAWLNCCKQESLLTA